MLNAIKKYKKIIVIALGIVIYSTTIFFSGYTVARNKYNGIDTESSTKLIREQGDTIKALREQLSGGVEQSDVIIDEGEDIKDGVDNIGESVGEVANGLRSDIIGLSGVIERLEYYASQGSILEESNVDK